MGRTNTRKLPSAYHHGDLREALIDAAMRAAERGGQEAVSFTALARELGVSQAAPYRHFVDRSALLTEVGERGFKAYSSAVRKALAVADGRSALSRMAHAYKDFGLTRPGLYHVMFASGIMPAADLGSPLKLAAKECFDIMLDTLHPGLEDVARRRFGLKIWASVHGIVTMVEQGLLPPPANQAITVDSLVDELVADLELTMEAAVAAAARSPA
jgi:AcrR family transcriptional regulator